MIQEEVVIGSLWQVTIYAAFQRAKVYKENVTLKDKTNLKKCLLWTSPNIVDTS